VAAQNPAQIAKGVVPESGNDPNLIAVVHAWSNLPEHIRTAILALISTSEPHT
jgi:hypothetical protein